MYNNQFMYSNVINTNKLYSILMVRIDSYFRPTSTVRNEITHAVWAVKVLINAFYSLSLARCGVKNAVQSMLTSVLGSPDL